MSGSPDLHKAVVAIWGASNLDTIFKDYWGDAKRDRFPVLHDSEAEPTQPFPYCIFEQDRGSTRVRMSGTATANQEIREVPWSFMVQAKDNGVLSAKKIAANLINEILKVYGGHPTVSAGLDNYELDNGNILIAQYQTDYGARTDLENWSWVVSYVFKLDVQVAL